MKAKNKNLIFLFIAFLTLPYLGMAQSKKKADKETMEWRYEIEAVGTGTQGSYQVKVWSYSKKPETILEQAKKNAVHGIIFKGFANKDRVPGQKALAPSPGIESEKADFFDAFFAQGGDYQKYITLTNNGAIAPGDRINMGKEYKIGVVVSVNVAALRKDLETAGVIKSLDNGF
jgi:hypothetical protein